MTQIFYTHSYHNYATNYKAKNGSQATAILTFIKV